MDDTEVRPLKKRKVKITEDEAYPFQETHFLEFWTSVGQPLQSMGQIICR